MSRRRSAGYSLVELLIVVAIIGILAGVAIGSASPGPGQRLDTAAEMLAADIAYCRSLAVTYNSKYVLTFEADQNRYVLTHSGANATLNILPVSISVDYSDGSTQHTVDLDDVPALGGRVRLAGVRTAGAGAANVTTLEFGPLGETTRSQSTVVWLMTDSGDAARYLPVTIDPVTGLTTVGELQAAVPTGVTPPAADGETVNVGI